MDNAPTISNLDAMRKAQQNLSKSVPTSQGGAFGGRDLLKLDKLGNWGIGQECTPPTGNIVVLPTSFEHGIILWENFKLIDEMMVSVFTDAPTPDQTRYPNSPKWTAQMSFHCSVIGTDQQLLYKTSSMGGLEFAKAIFDAICHQLDQDKLHPVPEIELSCSSYVGKSGKVFKPEYRIVDWHSMDGAEPEKIETTKQETARIRTRTRRA